MGSEWSKTNSDKQYLKDRKLLTYVVCRRGMPKMYEIKTEPKTYDEERHYGTVITAVTHVLDTDEGSDIRRLWKAHCNMCGVHGKFAYMFD